MHRDGWCSLNRDLMKYGPGGGVKAGGRAVQINPVPISLQFWKSGCGLSVVGYEFGTVLSLVSDRPCVAKRKPILVLFNHLVLFAHFCIAF
jgi:hypothetical protein